MNKVNYINSLIFIIYLFIPMSGCKTVDVLQCTITIKYSLFPLKYQSEVVLAIPKDEPSLKK